MKINFSLLLKLGIIVFMFISNSIRSQCNYSITPTGPRNISSTTPTAFCACLLPGLHYTELTGLVSGNTYHINFYYWNPPNPPSIHGYVTIRTISGTLLAHGPSPFEWTSTVTGAVRAHWSTSVGCGSSSFVYYGEGYNVVPLPLKFLDFKVKNKGVLNELNWMTTNEVNCNYMDVEYSIDGINFDYLGLVYNNRKSLAINNYSFQDFEIENSIIKYYRIKQVDYDGQYSYSEIVSVDNINHDKLIKIIYNPLNSSLQIKGNNQEINYSLNIYDVMGRAVLRKDWTDEEIEIISLPHGIYLAVLEDESGVVVGKERVWR